MSIARNIENSGNIFLRLLSSDVKPPVPGVEDQDIIVLPELPTPMDGVEYQCPPGIRSHNIDDERVPGEPQLQIVVLQQSRVLLAVKSFPDKMLVRRRMLEN